MQHILTFFELVHVHPASLPCSFLSFMDQWHKVLLIRKIPTLTIGFGAFLGLSRLEDKFNSFKSTSSTFYLVGTWGLGDFLLSNVPTCLAAMTPNAARSSSSPSLVVSSVIASSRPLRHPSSSSSSSSSFSSQPRLIEREEDLFKGAGQQTSFSYFSSTSGMTDLFQSAQWFID